MRKIIDIQNGQLTDGRYQMAQPVNFSLCEGEQIAIYGPNGAGKTRFVEIISGRHRLKPGGSITYDFSGSAHKYVSDNIKERISFNKLYINKTEKRLLMKNKKKIFNKRFIKIIVNSCYSI